MPVSYLGLWVKMDSARRCADLSRCDHEKISDGVQSEEKSPDAAAIPQYANMDSFTPSNADILNRQSQAKAAKKKARQGRVQEVVFNDAARRFVYCSGGCPLMAELL